MLCIRPWSFVQLFMSTGEHTIETYAIGTCRFKSCQGNTPMEMPIVGLVDHFEESVIWFQMFFHWPKREKKWNGTGLHHGKECKQEYVSSWTQVPDLTNIHIKIHNQEGQHMGHIDAVEWLCYAIVWVCCGFFSPAMQFVPTVVSGQ